jgi:hypothetical protein
VSAKWTDISSDEIEAYELIAPTSRGMVHRQRRAQHEAAYTAAVEEGDGTQQTAPHTFGDLNEAKIWVENEMARTLGRQVGA